MSSTYETIRQRRTIRRFQQTPISDETLLKLIDAARLAPSGANIQPCEYVIVDNTEMLDQIYQHLKWAAYIAPEGDPPEAERPVCYIVVLINTELKQKGGEADAGAAIMNILLSAWEEGIGSCWMGAINREGIRSVLAVPEKYMINSVIALGYANEQPVVEVFRDSVRYWKSEDGVLHVPKRRVEDIMHRNHFSHSG